MRVLSYLRSRAARRSACQKFHLAHYNIQASLRMCHHVTLTPLSFADRRDRNRLCASPGVENPRPAIRAGGQKVKIVFTAIALELRHFAILPPLSFADRTRRSPRFLPTLIVSTSGIVDKLAEILDGRRGRVPQLLEKNERQG